MPFPQTRDELIKRGYVFTNHAKCRGCGEDIEWYISPNQKKIPMNLMLEGSSPAVAHWATCEERDRFR